MFPNAFVSLAILFSASCFLCIKADENEKIRKQWMDVNSQRIIKEYLGRFKVFVDYVLENGSSKRGKNYSSFSLTAPRVIPNQPMRSGIISAGRKRNYDQSLYNAIRNNDNIQYIRTLMSWKNEADVEQYVNHNFGTRGSTIKKLESSHWKKLFNGIGKVYGTMICCRLADLAITTFGEYRVLVAPAANAAGDTDLKKLLSDNDAVLNYIAGQLDALNELTGNNIGTIINKDDLPTVWKAVTLDVSYIINDIRIPNMPNIRLPTK